MKRLKRIPLLAILAVQGLFCRADATPLQSTATEDSLQLAIYAAESEHSYLGITGASPVNRTFSNGMKSQFASLKRELSRLRRLSDLWNRADSSGFTGIVLALCFVAVAGLIWACTKMVRSRSADRNDEQPTNSAAALILAKGLKQLRDERVAREPASRRRGRTLRGRRYASNRKQR